MKRRKAKQVRCEIGSGFFGGTSCVTWKMYACKAKKKKVYFCHMHHHMIRRCCVEVDRNGKAISKNGCSWKHVSRCHGILHHCRKMKETYCWRHALDGRCCRATDPARLSFEDSVYVPEDVSAMSATLRGEKLWGPDKKMRKEAGCKYVKVAKG